MDAVVGMIMNRSEVTVEHIKITKATEKSVTLSLVNRLTKTGPTSATLSPMVVDLVFGGATWGKLQLPEIVTSPNGSDIIIAEQEVQITNMDSFRAFVKALMLDNELTLTLDNGEGQVAAKIMGFTVKSNIVYKKDLVIKGMGGPKLSVVDTAADSNTMKILNPSPLEINHGVTVFDVVDASGASVAEIKGQLDIVRGNFDSTMAIHFAGGSAIGIGSELRLVGKGVEGAGSWMNDTIKYINAPFTATEKFSSFAA